MAGQGEAGLGKAGIGAFYVYCFTFFEKELYDGKTDNEEVE